MQAESTQPTKLPSAFKLFEPSLEALKLNAIPLALMILTPIAAIFILAFFMIFAGWAGTANDAMLVIASLFSVAAILATIALFLIISPATTALQLRSAQGDVTTYGQAFTYGKRFWLRYLGLGICMSLIIGIGFLLFIIPGLFMLRRYILAPYYMLDRNLGVFDSLSKSAEDSKRFAGPIWGLIGVQFLIALVNFFPFGFIVSVIYLCAPAVRYLEIKHATGAHHPGHPHVPAAPHAPHPQAARL